MSKAIDYLKENQDVIQMEALFPRFLNKCPIYEIKDLNICFLDGGRGAPQAVDTIEILKALGVKTVISVGMCGAYASCVNIGDILIPRKAFVEEGTSLHYYEPIEYARPNFELYKKAMSLLKAKDDPIVSVDAIYRQTVNKERLWIQKGAVGVDMETSALFSVGKYLDMDVVALLFVSDLHGVNAKNKKWQWAVTDKMRYKFVDQVIELVKHYE